MTATSTPAAVEASVTRRGVAAVIDLTVLWAVPTVLYQLLGRVGAHLWAANSWSFDSYVTTFQIVAWTMIAVQLWYLIAAEVLVGHTWGKRAARITVVTADAGPLTVGRAARRRAAQLLLPATPLLDIVAAVRRTPRLRPVQDTVSHTRVIMDDTAPSRAPWRYVADLARSRQDGR